MDAHNALTAANIARESAKIGGFFPTKRNHMDPEYRALVELYGHVLNAHTPTLTNPIIFNAAICCTNGAAKWRTGIPAGMSNLPKGEACKFLHHRWWRRVQREMIPANEHGDVSGDKNLAHHVCMELYAEFLCIRPFRNGNGRTALLVLYMLRRYVGLPLWFIDYEQAPKLTQWVDRYRTDTFLPHMHDRSCMMTSK